MVKQMENDAHKIAQLELELLWNTVERLELKAYQVVRDQNEQQTNQLPTKQSKDKHVLPKKADSIGRLLRPQNTPIISEIRAPKRLSDTKYLQRRIRQQGPESIRRMATEELEKLWQRVEKLEFEMQTPQAHALQVGARVQMRDAGGEWKDGIVTQLEDQATCMSLKVRALGHRRAYRWHEVRMIYDIGAEDPGYNDSNDQEDQALGTNMKYIAKGGSKKHGFGCLRGCMDPTAGLHHKKCPHYHWKLQKSPSCHDTSGFATSLHV